MAKKNILCILSWGACADLRRLVTSFFLTFKTVLVSFHHYQQHLTLWENAQFLHPTILFGSEYLVSYRYQFAEIPLVFEYQEKHLLCIWKEILFGKYYKLFEVLFAPGLRETIFLACLLSCKFYYTEGKWKNAVNTE